MCQSSSGSARTIRALVVATSALLATGSLVLFATPALASTVTTTITTPGQTAYSVPANTISLQVTVTGAAGSSAQTGAVPPGVPGEGAKVQATLVPPAGFATLYAEVGTVGGGGTSDFAAKGGGKSAIQTCPNGGGCTYTGTPSTDPRLIVAGGGGGGGEDSDPTSGGTGGTGGNAGVSATVTGPAAGGDGTQSGNGGNGGGAGLGTTAAAAPGGAGSSACGGSGGMGSAGLGGTGEDNQGGAASIGGGGGDGWVGGSGGGDGDCPFGSGQGAGGGGGAGASFWEASATSTSITSVPTGTTPEVVIVATIATPPAITSGDSATFTVGAAGTFPVTTTGTPTPSLSDGGATLPSGVTFTDNGDGTATLAGTPGAGTGGTYPFTITAANGVSPNATQSFTLTVDQAPAITSADAITFTVGEAGTFPVTTTGYPGGPTLTLSDGGATLPSGVTFTDNGDGTATLAGTPGAGTGGTYAFTITAANGVSPNATQSFTLTVDQAPAITSANATTFTVGEAGTFPVTTTGYPGGPTLTLSDGGATLPSGVTFTDNGDGTATLAGTPADGSAGTFPFTITATNGVAPSATQSFTLTVMGRGVVMTVTASPMTVGLGSPVTITATVAAALDSGIPTGTVSFSDAPIGGCQDVALVSGLARCTTTSLPPGSDLVTATYSGSSTFASGVLSVTVVVSVPVPATGVAGTASGRLPVAILLVLVGGWLLGVGRRRRGDPTRV